MLLRRTSSFLPVIIASKNSSECSRSQWLVMVVFKIQSMVAFADSPSRSLTCSSSTSVWFRVVVVLFSLLVVLFQFLFSSVQVDSESFFFFLGLIKLPYCLVKLLLFVLQSSECVVQLRFCLLKCFPQLA